MLLSLFFSPFLSFFCSRHNLSSHSFPLEYPLNFFCFYLFHSILFIFTFNFLEPSLFLFLFRDSYLYSVLYRVTTNSIMFSRKSIKILAFTSPFCRFLLDYFRFKLVFHLFSLVRIALLSFNIVGACFLHSFLRSMGPNV